MLMGLKPAFFMGQCCLLIQAKFTATTAIFMPDTAIVFVIFSHAVPARFKSGR